MREYSPGEQAEDSEDREGGGTRPVTEKSAEKSTTREGVHNSNELTTNENAFKH